MFKKFSTRQHFPRKFSHWFDNAPASCPQDRRCDFQGCQETGVYRAPKSRYHLDQGINEWMWFCLTHIRDYNGKWNYYKGMTPQEIDEEWINDITWDRPSWPVSGSAETFTIADPFGFFSQETVESPWDSTPAPHYTAQDKEAAEVLGLSFPFTIETLQRQYRRLAKKYHPDCNGNSPQSHERIRALNEAYAVLKKRYANIR